MAAQRTPMKSGRRRKRWVKAPGSEAAMRAIADAKAALYGNATPLSFEEYQAQQEQLRREDEARRNRQSCLTLRPAE